MTYPIMQRELTVHLHNNSWYLRPIEDEEKIQGPVDYGWHRFNLYPDSFTRTAVSVVSIANGQRRSQTRFCARIMMG